MSNQTTWQSTVPNEISSNDAVNQLWGVTYRETVPPPNIVYQEFLTALAKCFLVIFTGYVAAKFRLLNEQGANGLEIFVRQFALPSLIFLTLASVELNSVSWDVIKCFALAKTIVFIAVLLSTVFISKPINVGKAALYGIFCTQSNDLCLGLPIIESLYQSSHPEFSHYLYLLALVQFLLLNPFGFYLMELQRRKNDRGALDKSLINLLGALVKSTLLNPIIVMTFLGILANLCWNHQIPVILENFLNVLGAAFPALALFSLGYSLVSNSGTLIGTKLVVPSLLIITKILILPIINRIIMHLYVEATNSAEKETYKNFAFLYGTIPTAPTVYIFATQFGMETDIVAAGMVASTFLSAPLMFLSGSMTTVSDFTSSYLQADLNTAVMCTSCLGAFCSFWVLMVLLKAKKTMSITHSLTVYIVSFQLLTALGGIFQSVTDPHAKLLICIQNFVSLIGNLASYVWTSLLAFNMAILYGKSLCFSLHIQKYVRIFGHVTFFIVCLAAAIFQGKFFNSADFDEVYFSSNGFDTIIRVTVLVSCIFFIICCLISQQWYISGQQSKILSEHISGDNSTDSLIESDILEQTCISDDQKGVSDIELQYPTCNSSSYVPFQASCNSNSMCLNDNKSLCAGILKKYFLQLQESRKHGIVFEVYEDKHQVLKHLILVILLFISMIISLVLNFWKLMLKQKTDSYIELDFFNSTLSHGIGIISFAVFGFDRHLIINPCMWWMRKLCYNSNIIVLPAIQGLSLKTRSICDIFLTYHLKSCVQDIVEDKKLGAINYSNVFCGKDLVDWLLKVGLSHTRTEAEEYGNHLLLGRVIKHIKQRYYFEDLPHLYMFVFPESYR